MLSLFNTLTKSQDEVVPLEPGVVKMYTCGPTVYRDAHIGNLRSYLLADWIRRILEVQGLKISHVKNITDVGHMRQEVLERGEDKVIAAALAEGKTPAPISHGKFGAIALRTWPDDARVAMPFSSASNVGMSLSHPDGNSLAQICFNSVAAAACADSYSANLAVHCSYASRPRVPIPVAKCCLTSSGTRNCSSLGQP